MKKVNRVLFLILLLMATGASHHWAGEQLPPKLQSITDEAYRAYSARDTENFLETIQRIKAATEFSEY